jgi:hypothetical protein
VQILPGVSTRSAHDAGAAHHLVLGFFSLWRQSGFPKIRRQEPRFTTHVEGLVGAIDHADRAGPLRDYGECVGPVLPGDCEIAPAKQGSRLDAN